MSSNLTEKNGNGTMAHNGNGVTSNGTENGSNKQIDEGLYSRQLFVLGESINHNNSIIGQKCIESQS